MTLTAGSEDPAGVPPALRGEAGPNRDRSRWTLLDWLLIAGVLLIATLIRVDRIDPAPSADEIWQIAMTAGEGSPVGRYADDRVYVDAPGETTLANARPFWRIWTTMSGIQHPPLYHVTLRLWRDVFGGSDGAAHAYSIAWAAIAIGFTVAAARLAMDRFAAAAVGAIYAVAPVQIYLAQEIRNYSILAGVAAIAVWIATRIETSGATRCRAFALAATTLPLMLLHYFAAGAAVGIATYGIARLRGPSRRAFLVTLCIAGLGYAIAWAPFARVQFAGLYTFQTYAKVDRFDPLGEAWWTTAVPARLLIEGLWLDEARYAWPALAVGGVCFVAPWFLTRRLRALLPWAALLCGTAAAIVALDAFRAVWLSELIRYLAAASPAAPLLIVGIPWAVRPLAGYWAGVIAAGTLAIALIVTPRTRLPVIADGPYFTDFAIWASANVPRDDALIVLGGDAAREAQADLLLLTLAHEPALFPHTLVKLAGPPSAALRATLPAHGWVFLPGAVRLPVDPVLATLDVESVLLLPRQGLVARVALRRD